MSLSSAARRCWCNCSVVYYGLASFAAVRASIFWPFLREAFSCAVLALALCTAAYQSEIFRMALAAIPQGQIEAARACGMSRLTLFRRIIFPIALRQALAGLYDRTHLDDQGHRARFAGDACGT